MAPDDAKERLLAARKQALARAILSFILGIIVLFLVFAAVGLISKSIEGVAFDKAIAFIDENIWLMLLLALLLFVADILTTFGLPASLAAPPLSATGALLLLVLVLRAATLVADMLGTDALSFLGRISHWLYAAVFIIVLAAGYWLAYGDFKRRVEGRKSD